MHSSPAGMRSTGATGSALKPQSANTSILHGSHYFKLHHSRNTSVGIPLFQRLQKRFLQNSSVITFPIQMMWKSVTDYLPEHLLLLVKRLLKLASPGFMEAFILWT